MNGVMGARPPLWFWIAAILALCWNLLGVAAYLAEAFGFGSEMRSSAVQSLTEARPAWATAAYAVAVFGGAAGCLALLIRRHWARGLLILSLVALLVQQGWTFLISDALALLGPRATIFPALVVAVSIALVWLAGFAGRKGWLR